MRRSFGLLCCAMAGCLLPVQGALGQGFPNRPISIVVAFTPEGPSDRIARLLARRMEDFLGQPSVILNRPGAGGNLAAEQVARAVPDGYTLLLGNNSIFAANASLYKRLAYDALEDFAPISLIGTQPSVLVVSRTVSARTVSELITHVRLEPDTFNYASSGYGTAAHLAAELFKTKAKLDIRHVPYKGAAPALQDVVSGEVHVMFATSASVLAYIKPGLVRALAVTTRDRSPLFPELPTIAELGFPGFDISTWHALLAPVGTPSDVLGLLTRTTTAALKDTDVAKELSALGIGIIAGTPEELAQHITDEIPRWTAIVRSSGARMD